MERFPTVLIPSDWSAAVEPIGVHVQPRRGRSEAAFEQELCRYFPGKIHAGLMVPNPERPQPYVPDFAYIDPATNLHIDIEIDEPYTHDTRLPLHYRDCPKDELRNQWFLANGWIVIRLSEAQVIKSPASCCKVIASTIATLTQDSTIMTAFRQVPTLKPQPRWTFDQAQQMAARGDREQLMPEPIAPGQRKRGNAVPTRRDRVPLTFFCPECGEGPIRWQGHYICCPNCSNAGFA
ncbi:hypothetical protein H6F67_24040 [Microcoleus sp. FACHB-1515]|uniref:hypothetical protein n=1 Tax=Cyanophyceae TaxID=3028117 RepID=UPI00168526AD|nr:hypothetical protein [Microcoleus sp. FACHB-1515]MBD2092924.1 hypothetical protein [Microcoleus sp. FACHB-1515]